MKSTRKECKLQFADLLLGPKLMDVLVFREGLSKSTDTTELLMLLLLKGKVKQQLLKKVQRMFLIWQRGE